MPDNVEGPGHTADSSGHVSEPSGHTAASSGHTATPSGHVSDQAASPGDVTIMIPNDATKLILEMQDSETTGIGNAEHSRQANLSVEVPLNTDTVPATGKSSRAFVPASVEDDEHVPMTNQELTCELVAYYLERNTVSPEAVTAMVAGIKKALDDAPAPTIETPARRTPRTASRRRRPVAVPPTESAEPAEGRPADQPAVPVEESVTDDYIICLEDGKKLKMLKRYLKAKYDMTPDEYREKWNLPPDYPMVSKNYSDMRSNLTRQHHHGRDDAPDAESSGAPLPDPAMKLTPELETPAADADGSE